MRVHNMGARARLCGRAPAFFVCVICLCMMVLLVMVVLDLCGGAYLGIPWARRLTPFPLGIPVVHLGQSSAGFNSRRATVCETFPSARSTWQTDHRGRDLDRPPRRRGLSAGLGRPPAAGVDVTGCHLCLHTRWNNRLETVM